MTFAKALAEAGAHAALGARPEDRLADTRKPVEAVGGRRAITVRTDVTRPEDCQALVDAAMAEFGRVDVLVNNAGVGTAVPAVRETPEQFRSVVELIDFIHVVQYLWKAAGSFFYTGDPAARQWVVEQSRKILDGKATDVAAGIRRRATRFGYTGKERDGADTCATYLDHKAAYLDYPAFLTAGRPIATGLIEGACHWLIKDRMQVTGARWTLDNAEAVLKLRALAGNGDFDDYFTYHQQQEKRRNHDNHYQQPAA